MSDTLTHEARIVAAARALNKRHAELCNVNEADSWMIQGDDFREDARAALAAADAALSVPAVPLTPRDVARQVFALCEQFEDLQDSPADSFGLQRHIAGQRFAAKRIRNAIGDWLTEQERAHNITGAPDHG